VKKSESQAAIGRALFEAHKEYPPIAKTKEGQQGNRKFMYAPMEDILHIIGPVLEYELLVTQPVEGHSIVTRVEHIPSGEWREASMPVNEEHANMQSYGIELTYRKRYAIQGVLGIITEEDTDGAGGQKRKGGKDHTEPRNENGTGQGPRVSAAAEIAGQWERQADPRRISELDDLALTLIDAYNAKRGLEAAKLYYGLADNDEKVYVWNCLKQESKLRSFLRANTPHQQKEQA
jgi:hypothetical protein